MRALALGIAAVLLTAPLRAEPVRTIPVGGLVRSYAVTRVGADAATGRLPVVIVLHGLGQLIADGPHPRYGLPFEAHPELGPALVVRPQGVNRRWDAVPGRIATWRRLSATDGTAVDDIAFLRTLIDHLVLHQNGDPARVYVAGISAGGFLVPRVACEMGDKVAAVADVIATSVRSVFQGCNPATVPFALIASTTDETNPYAGAPGDEVSRLASAPETAAFFARHNGCATRTETPLPATDREHRTSVTLTRFSGCAAEVLFWRVDGAGHSVPSTAPLDAAGWEASGRRNQDLDSVRAVWDFFRVHRRAP